MVTTKAKHIRRAAAIRAAKAILRLESLNDFSGQWFQQRNQFGDLIFGVFTPAGVGYRLPNGRRASNLNDAIAAWAQEDA